MFRGLYSIPRHNAFLPALAGGLRAATDANPLVLANTLVLVPNRRSTRVLRDVFLDQAVDNQQQGASVLPRLLTFGDLAADDTALALGALDGLELQLPPVTGHERLVQLAKFVKLQDPSLSAVHALALAQDLGTLFNELARYDTDVTKFEGLVEGEGLAEHWKHTLKFISVITTLWPAYLRTINRSDPALYQAAVIKHLASTWQASPPQHPVIIAGMARAEPVLIDLAKSVLAAPHGAVVLPGFDTTASEDTWRDLDIVHPDRLLRDVLEVLGATRSAVQEWPAVKTASPAQHSRAAWVNLAMLPAASTVNWQAQAKKVITPSCLQGVTQVTADDEAGEATTVALIIRRELETPGQTISLLTADRTLARRVAALLLRWGIVADDSSGLPFTASRLAIYLQLVAAAAHPDATSADLLALLKHPLCQVDADIDAVEVGALRGEYPAAGFAGLTACLQRKGQGALAERLHTAVGSLAAVFAEPQAEAAVLLRAHIAAAQAMTGDKPLWFGPEGEVASGALSTLLETMPHGTPLTADDYLPWLMQILSTCSVRVPYGQHPRVTIHGLIEARLQQADVMIIAGLNEGVWPALPAANPWLNRKMRTALGLPSPDEVIAQQAHDFVSAMAAPTIYLTRAARRDGAPTMPARWWHRLRAVLTPLGLDKQLDAAGDDWQTWVRLLDAPAMVQALPPPAPCPPVAARPRELSYSSIETWMRNPYGLYAKHILGLRALKPLADVPGVAERGTFMHDALAEFFDRTKGRALSPTDWDILLDCGKQALDKLAHLPGVQAFWWPWFVDVAGWFWRKEQQQRPVRVPALWERKGEYVWHDWAGGDFAIHAKADRIDADNALQGAVVIDYKTGAPPTNPDVVAGLSPQLNLEALLVSKGAYEGVTATGTVQAEYWHLGGTAARCKIDQRDVDITTTEQGLRALVEAFNDAATPYHAAPIAARAPRYDDYAHLARTAEWSAQSGEDAA